MSAVLHKVNKPEGGDPSKFADYIFWCPGCKFGHAIYTEHPNSVAAKWTFNSNMEKPTFSPSLLIKTGAHVCHSNVIDGQIMFHGDSTHHLSGETVPMEPFPA